MSYRLATKNKKNDYYQTVHIKGNIGFFKNRTFNFRVRTFPPLTCTTLRILERSTSAMMDIFVVNAL